MLVTGLNHFTITASAETIDECVAFYCNILNLRIGFRPPSGGPGFWLYAGDLALVRLDVADHSLKPHTGLRIAFSCVNLPVTIRRLEDLGISYSTHHLADVDQFQVFLNDPTGLPIELNFSCEQI